ncbi:MAG: P-II family nitrogen regulator [Candidatus Scalindua sp.]
MKLIKVIFRPEKILELKDALTKLGYHGITFKANLGFGEQRKKIKQVFRGKIYEKRADATKRAEIEFVVADYRVEKVIETIRSIAATEEEGDGRIYIFPMENAIHIHSGSKHLGDSSETGFSGDI